MEVFLEKVDDSLDIKTVDSPERALNILEKDDFDAVVSDYIMPEIDGLEFLQMLRDERKNDIPFLIFTGKGREEVAMEALNLGADRYLQKGGDPMSQYSVLAQAIKQEVRHHKTQIENEELSRDLKQTFDAISHPIFLLDIEHRILRTNKAAERFFRVDEDRLLDEYCYRIAHDQDEPIEDCPLERSLDTKEVEELEFYSENLDKYFIARTTPILDDDGNIEKVVHQEIDITDFKKKEIELRKSKNLFESIFNDPNIFIGILDTEGNILRANEKALEFVGRSMEELRDKKFWNTPWWTHSEELQERLKAGIKRAAIGEFVRFKVEHHGRDEKKVTLDFSLRPVYNDDDEVVRLIAEGKNITDI